MEVLQGIGLVVAWLAFIAVVILLGLAALALAFFGGLAALAVWPATLVLVVLGGFVLGPIGALGGFALGGLLGWFAAQNDFL